MKKIIIVIIFVLYLITFLLAQEKPFFQESVVWEFEEDGYWPYHVPGVTVTSNGTILVYADARYDDPGDFGPHDIAMKRSTDYGKTWGENKIVVKGKNKEIYLFPNVFQPRNSDSVLFIYTQKNPENIHTKTHVFVKYSSDDGLNWSEPQEITKSLTAHELILKKQIINRIAGVQFENENPDLYAREQFYTGPGNIIQLSKEHPVAPNRIIVPLLVVKHRNLPILERGQGNAVLISDDNGKTWKAGGTLPIGILPNGEPGIIELSNGYILMNSRVEGNTMRVISISNDGGMTWSEATKDSSIPSFHETHAGMQRMSSHFNPPNWNAPLLFSFPDSDYRENLTIMASFDETFSWAVKKVIHEGASYYSNMAVLPDGTCLLIYGKYGKKGAIHIRPEQRTPKGNHGWFPDMNVVARFNLEWLLQ